MYIRKNLGKKKFSESLKQAGKSRKYNYELAKELLKLAQEL